MKPITKDQEIKNLYAAIIGYIRNGMTNYEISEATNTPMDLVEKIRKQLELEKCIK